MKRTLFEILCATGMLVLLASFHQQISRLRLRTNDVDELRQIVTNRQGDGERTAALEQEIGRVRTELIGNVDHRLAAIEARVEKAAERIHDASFLRRELDAARRETTELRAEVERDVTRTQKLVDDYKAELAARDQAVENDVIAARAVLDQLQTRMPADPSVLQEELLAPTIQLNGDDTVGSGTIVYSERDEKTGSAKTYALTAWHVVRNIYADSPRSRQDGIAITVYRTTGNVDVRAEVVCHDESIDAALLRFRSDDVFPEVARVMPREQTRELTVWDPIYAIGCPLGNDPIPTSGELASKQNVLNGTNYWMINAPTYYGNSGGGVFSSDDRLLIGVFSKIYTHGRGNPVVVPHMGLCTPIATIYEWLDKHDHGWVLEQEDDRFALTGIAPAPAK